MTTPTTTSTGRTPALDTFTVTVAEPARLTPIEPFTYVLHAKDLEDARTIALSHHIRTYELDRHWETGEPIANPDAAIVEGPAATFAGTPPWPDDTAGHAWNDLRTDPVALALAGDVSAIIAAL
jgi:hypothetical protein